MGLRVGGSAGSTPARGLRGQRPGGTAQDIERLIELDPPAGVREQRGLTPRCIVGEA